MLIVCEYKKNIGFGPFTLIGVGSASAAMLAIIVQPTAPLALMGSTISGISFLGAGALIKGSDGGVQGFTTGALVILSAFVGINIGSGMYVMGVSFFCKKSKFVQSYQCSLAMSPASSLSLSLSNLSNLSI
jgi:uncharacterized membrane protein YhiD involved in acid resistance